MKIRASTALAVVAITHCLTPDRAAAGQAPPDYGMTWCTVGAPGNRLPNAQEAPA